MKITQPFEYPRYYSNKWLKTWGVIIGACFRAFSERLEWGLFAFQGSFEGIDKDKLEETLREANKSFSGWRR